VAHGLEHINWSAPWLAPWCVPGAELARQVAQGQTVAQALNGLQQAPKVFVPQADLPPGVAYEQFIFDHAQVPTRDGLHDFFNGLAWLHFPQTKIRLNLLQAEQIRRTGIQPVRGPARDALTVVDENAALLEAPDALWDALCRKDWYTAFVRLRPLWQEAHLILFGHALLEKLVAPRKPITAHVLRVRPGGRELSDLDAWLARDLTAEKLAGKPFAHLPVLGVPGWWPDNENEAFYADSAVFRPARA